MRTTKRWVGDDGYDDDDDYDDEDDHDDDDGYDDDNDGDDDNNDDDDDDTCTYLRIFRLHPLRAMPGDEAPLEEPHQEHAPGLEEDS